ncbi:hypothetical protein Csa_001487 [Cucumis sativus]|nr:hypothetical protein Csa_001487 [Cucumis sativus]
MSSGAVRLLVLDFALSFMWLWSGVLVKIFVFGILGFGNDLVSEVVKASFSILNMFFFAFLVKISNGSAYNPLTILSAAFSGDFSKFLFTVGARIPAQGGKLEGKLLNLFLYLHVNALSHSILKLRNQLVSHTVIRSNDPNSLEDILRNGFITGVSYMYSSLFEASRWCNAVNLLGKRREVTLWNLKFWNEVMLAKWLWWLSLEAPKSYHLPKILNLVGYLHNQTSKVIGAITAVRLIIHTFPEAGRGPRLAVGIHHGALTEGLLTFAIVSISLGLSRKIVGNFFMKTWISSLSKLTLHILGSDLTGGCMNPASVMGWAYARGEHITTEHILVYWIAPIQGTIAAVLTFKLIFRQPKQEKVNMKKKSE